MHTNTDTHKHKHSGSMRYYQCLSVCCTCGPTVGWVETRAMKYSPGAGCAARIETLATRVNTETKTRVSWTTMPHKSLTSDSSVAKHGLLVVCMLLFIKFCFLLFSKGNASLISCEDLCEFFFNNAYLLSKQR